MPGSARHWAALLAVMAIAAGAGFVRLHGLERPGRIYFDESYYVEDARSYLERGVEEERPAHPPMGKWVIAAGIELAGDRPLGWRIANVVLGTLTVAAVMVAGRLLTGRWWPALVAGVLVALDGLAFVGSRIGMLDGSLSWWGTAGFLALVVDHHRPAHHRAVPSGWRLAAGALLGLAVATKWSGLLALGAGSVVAGLTDVAALRAGTAARRASRVAWRLVLPFVVVPAAVYVAAYGPWLVSYPHTETARERCEEGDCGTGLDDRVAGWWREQRELVAFHDRLQATHPDRAEAWRWPLLDEPILMFLERCEADAVDCSLEPGQQRRILGLGSPAVWWPALVAVPALAVVAWRRRWWAGAAVLAFGVGQWAPWLLAPKPGFSFYLIPVVPFAALALALVCWVAGERAGRPLAVALAAAAVAAFVFWRPFFVGSVLDADAVELRALLASWD